MISHLRAFAVVAVANMVSVHAAGNSTGSTGNSTAAGAKASNATSTTTSAAAKAAALSKNAGALNQDFNNYIFIVLTALAAAFAVWRVGIEGMKFQLIFLTAYFASNISFCVVSINWNQPLATVCSQLRNRTGTLAVVNMIPLFIMAARNNPLINLLALSFDTFNLLHRWTGRIVVLEILAHVISWMVSTVASSGWSAVGEAITGTPFIMCGFVGTCAAVVISIQASSVIRHAFYETFKYLHIALVAVLIVGIWYHLKLKDLPQATLLYGVISLWVIEQALRVLIVMYRNVGNGGSKTLVEALPGNACRVTIDMARPWNFKPGQHAYLYMPSVGLWTSHPFSVAWSDEAEKLDNEKLAMNRQDILAMKKTTVSFVIRARTGFTNKLYKKAEASADGRFYTKCFAEGPYGGMHMMHSYGTVMLFAGGVGITHQVPHVRDLVAGYANGTVATRKIVLVWIIQSPEHLEWIRPWMTAILAMDKRRECLRIMLFVSRPRSTKEIHSPSATVQMFPGRPNIETLIDMEMENQVGALGVTVCGSGALSDDVRRAARTRQNAGNIDFIEEAFSW